MKNKHIILLLAVVSVLSVSGRADTKPNDRSLKIYLPREITIEGNAPTLGQVAILRGSEQLVALADNIALGRLATPDQNLTIDKNTVLSRLASNGIAASRVTLTGAEETVISRRHQLISDQQFVEAATAFLKRNLPDPSICQMDVIRTPGSLMLPGAGENIKLGCSLVNNGMSSQGKVLVTAFEDNKEVGRKEVIFRFRYQCRKVVTKTPVAKGDIISTGNITVEKGVSNFPEPAGWAAPYGLIATRDLPAKAVLTDTMVTTPAPEVLIKRNQGVSIRIENAGLVASAIGKALQDGTAGQYIKVQNVDSKIIITAKVCDDGTVEPVY